MGILSIDYKNSILRFRRPLSRLFLRRFAAMIVTERGPHATVQYDVGASDKHVVQPADGSDACFLWFAVSAHAENRRKSAEV